jgi:predicted P-loop ATPase
MSILRALLNAGVLPNDAQILDQNFANEPDFLAGLEQIARCLATQEPPGNLPPGGEPWKTIYGELLVSSNGLNPAFNQALGGWPPPVQMAISGAVAQRTQDIQQWLQQTQTQGKKRKSSEYIRILQNLGYSFKYNLCTHNIEVNGNAMSDPLQAEIRGKLRDASIFEVNIVEDAYFAHAWQNRYHPIRDYLTGLKYQGGKEIEQLAGFFQDDRGIFETLLRRFLVGACARVMAGEQNRMLVLDGSQGLGKDYFAKWLCSPMPEYFHEGPIMPDEKDHRLRLMSCWIWNVNELGSTTRRSDREALKAFLTIQTVRERKPYGRFDIQGQAMASFIGTVNNEGGILNDPTGHRRFMIATLQAIDWDYTKIDIDQVWAQAFDLYLAGEPWRLAGDELDIVNEINESYQVVDIVEETIKKFFMVDPEDTISCMSTIEILDVLKDPLQGNLKAGSEIDPRRLASALTKLGLDKAKPIKRSGTLFRGYFGIRRII